MTLGLFWAAFALPGGVYVPLALSFIGCASAAIDAAGMVSAAFSGQSYQIMSPLRSVVVHRRAMATGAIALTLLFSGIGLHSSFFLTQPVVKPIAWRIWAVEPAPNGPGARYATPVRMVGPYLCKVRNSPNGLVLNIVGGGAIWLTDDAAGKPVWGVGLYDLDRVQALLGVG